MTIEQPGRRPIKFNWKRNAINFVVWAVLNFCAVAAVSYFFGPIEY